MPKPYLKIAESTNNFIQVTLLSTIFVFKSNISQIGSIFEKILAPILFPLVVVPDAITSLFALYHFSQAKNKNLGKTFDLIHAPIKAALVFTAVFAGLSLVFTQGLFLTAVGSSVAYHLGLSIFHAFHWLKSEKNSPARTLHKTHAINNLISTTAGGIVIAGIVLTMVIAPYLAATILAVAGITAATMLMLTTVLAIYRNFKNPPVYPTIDPVLSDESSETFDDSSSFASTLSDDALSIPSKNQNSNYYYIECPLEEITTDFEKNKQIILDKIHENLTILNNQIKKPEYFWPEKSKRQKKIDLYEKFKSLLDRPKEETHNAKKDFVQLVESTPNKAYQSFFKAKGKVESIQDAIEKHLDLICGSN